MLEFDTKYHPGKRTFAYLFIRHSWWLFLVGAGLCYLAYEMYIGQLQSATAQFLAEHADWYITDAMVSQWALFAGAGVLLIAYLRASVLYRAHSFQLSDHALHLRRGLIRVQEITIPYQQVSNIHIEQPYHWRMLGLARLDITIASSRTSLSEVRKKQDFLIPCIDASLAREMSRFLVKEASGEEEDETDEEFEEESDSEDIIIGAAQ